MSKRIFITATNTDIGKTYTTIQLMEAFTKMGLRVGVYKPIETGVNGLPADGSLLLKHAQSLNPELKALRINDIVSLSLPLPAAPYVANKGKKIDLALFDRALEKIESLCDIVLIEGAGGLMVPVDHEHMMIDFPRYFNALTLLVTHCKLGCINDTLLSLTALKNANLPHLWVLNCRSDDENFTQVSLPYFKNNFDPLFMIGQDNTALAQALLDKINQENSKGE
ncbi:MAG TPA: dethiobiotin synthase [Sulfuricurvum sp.]|nr:MAG: dethiobiotin synthase [Campylobacterales bacterium 16-40-21]OZA04397.1 MAG: dethiobiotin synthase [Sulfuricurvum sp. 17-40-25]HQS66420.1 dethiobiotin synthase [Sulfuricurvum sp.]HQT36815.1 dethiobiotin synthase [Sulfuricurvum sp.]